MAQYQLYLLTSIGTALAAPIVVERDDDEAALWRDQDGGTGLCRRVDRPAVLG